MMETTWRLEQYVRRVAPVWGMLLGLMVLALLIWWRPSPHVNPVPVAQLATARLSTSGSGAMFAVDRLVPDRPVYRCLDVQYEGTATIGSVAVAAVDVTGALAPYLRIGVEQSRDGASADCAGFAADAVFAGTLRDLANVGPLGVDTKWTPAPASARSYRVTVTLESDAPQGQTSTATFRWVLTQNLQTPPAVLPSTRVPATPRPPSVGPSAPATPEPTSAEPSSAGPSVPALDSVSPAPFASSGAASTPSAGSGRRGTGGGSGHGLREQVASLINTVGEATRIALKLVAEHGRFPTLPAVLVAAFVTVQNRIDRRDPKLVAAPLWRDNYLTFPND